MKRKTTAEQIKHSAEYISFLEKRLASSNYLANTSREDVQVTKEKLKKEKLILKMLSAAK